ncbi:bactofilin family protein [Ideonella livida]|uniref:Polymer-forming cytoskeletal protein n=1 Tax=Ideonella livida TaxID=2707176 RepID=A0A7C9PJG7_9BURK|nr:polymer-forming cytoskeletal protein [Ideonella livida]NDY92634.1 polymer-forming cytoskeletal protein [Ideonella livida]
MWFGKRRKQPPIRSLIGEGTVVRGEVQFEDGLRVDGEIEGDIVATGAASLLVISENARIRGKVSAGHVIINGEVSGPVEALELLELQPKARVVGDVHYGALEMHQGATIQGALCPRSAGQETPALLENGAKPVLKLAASNEA